MPGMVMFRRRWSVGSDDLVLPALFLFLLHCIWWDRVRSVYLWSSFLFLCTNFLTSLRHTQVGCSVRGSVRPPLWLGPVVFCNAGGPWPGVSGHLGQLSYLWERHHVVEHERQHFVHAAQGSGAVRHLHTTRWVLFSFIRMERADGDGNILFPHPTWLPSDPVGRASVCCGGNCLACSVLPAVLWCHCQEPGSGWVKATNGDAWRVSIVDIRVMFCYSPQESLHATGLLYSVFALPSCAPLIRRVGPLSNWKLLAGVSATSRHTRSGNNGPLGLQLLPCPDTSAAGMHMLSLTRTGCSLTSSRPRHRLEEGQASSWSRRLKFFMCCTRAQDTQSVSHFLRMVTVKQTGIKAEPAACLVILPHKH